MLVTIMAFDKPNHVDLRMKTRPTHIAWLEKLADKIVFAGPMLDPTGEKSLGSVIVREFESLKDAEEFVKQDPYSKAGLFERVVIHRTRQVFPAAG